MRRHLLVAAAVLVPFGALVALGLSAMDAEAPPAAPVVAADRPLPPPAPPPPPTARAEPPPSPAPPAPAAAPAPPPPPPSQPPPPPPPPPLAAPAAPPFPAPPAPAPLPQPVPNRPGFDSPLEPLRGRRTPGLAGPWQQNGFPPQVLRALEPLVLQCWQEAAPRSAGPATITLLGRPAADGTLEGAVVKSSSWSDPVFLACVEDAALDVRFATGGPLPPGPVVHTFQLPAAPR